MGTWKECAWRTSCVNEMVGASLTSLTLNKLPAATDLSLKETESSTEGLKVSGMMGEGRRAALEREESRAEGSIEAAIVVSLKIRVKFRVATASQKVFVGYFLVLKSRRCSLVEDLSAKVCFPSSSTLSSIRRS